MCGQGDEGQAGHFNQIFFFLFSVFRQCNVIPGFGNFGFQQQEFYAEEYEH